MAHTDEYNRCCICDTHATVEYRVYKGVQLVKAESWITTCTHWHVFNKTVNTLREVKDLINDSLTEKVAA